MTQFTDTKPLWSETPLRYSHHISQLLGAKVYLKLENLQPSYSFKYRGISHFLVNKLQQHGPSTHFVIASGGNAGIAAACAARRLGRPCTVFIPDGASPSTLALLKSEEADVVVQGRFYAEAVGAAKALVEKEDHACVGVMVPAYDDPIIWEGHASMIEEIQRDLGQKPTAIFCSVGGAGLLGGILQGCKSVGWGDVPVVALETIGSDCFYHSMSLNGGRFNSSSRALPSDLDVKVVYDETHDVYLAHLNSFHSKASGSLGASQPAAGVMKMALEYEGGVKCVSVPDGLSMETSALFANDQKMLVELSCSTALVPAYHPALFDKLVPASPGEERLVVFIVCGGVKVSVEEVAGYKEELEREPKASDDVWEVKYDDGSLFSFAK